jgi:arsenate reductase
VFESYTALRPTATVTTYLPALTARVATERLTALAPAKGAITTDVPEVLFVCVHNAGRSQMAAGLLDAHAAGRVHVRSAGSLPSAQIDDAVTQAMAEVGIDISAQKPKVLTTDAVQASDVVITMGCGDACPIFPGKRYLDWALDDPVGQGVEAVRPIRDDIETRIRGLLAELGVPEQAAGAGAARTS